LLGAFLVGFLGLMGLARFMGRPVIVALGTNSLFAAALWVPITEEICKLLPLAFVLFFARRRSDARSSLLDVVVLAGCAAAGFAVSENASYGRGGFSLSAVPLVSLLSPAALKGSAFGWPMVQTGHLVHSALIALGIGDGCHPASGAFLCELRLR
jgi:RsiW-degrading membrane proteinase PrsW (M82 family)